MIKPKVKDIYKINLNEKYVIIFDRPISLAESVEIKESIKRFLTDDREVFLIAWGIKLEKIEQ